MRRPEAGLIAFALLVVACAIPTEAPNWDVVWDLPVPDSGQTIPISSFLPAGVSIVGTAPNEVFNLNVASAPAISRTLGAQCSTCPNATAQKPAFNAPPATSTISLTAGTALGGATLTTGSAIAVALNNGFSFDPIRPPGGSFGTITFAVNNGATTLGTLTLQGATSPIPAGQITNVSIPLSGSFNSAVPITVTMTMDSPAGAAGSPVTMNASQTFTATATPTLRISQATVTIASQPLVTDPATLDLSSGALASLEKRVADSTTTQGSMVLTITNPLTLGASGTVTFTGFKDVDTPSGTVVVPISAIAKPITIPASSPAATPSIVQIDFTGKELRELLGSEVTATITGTTNAGSTAITPTSAIAISSRFQIRAFVREFK